jgi:hypothetical protein
VPQVQATASAIEVERSVSSFIENSLGSGCAAAQWVTIGLGARRVHTATHGQNLIIRLHAGEAVGVDAARGSEKTTALELAMA